MPEFGQAEILRILAVTDAFGIHRESVRIPLYTQGAGRVRPVQGGRVIEIVAPDADFETWLARLPEALNKINR